MAKLILTPEEFQVNTFEDFLKLAEKKDFRLAKAIVKAILANITTRKRFINVMSVSILSTGETIELTADRKEFAEILKKNLVHFEEQEMYEECMKIKEAIERLTLK